MKVWWNFVVLLLMCMICLLIVSLLRLCFFSVIFIVRGRMMKFIMNVEMMVMWLVVVLSMLVLSS